MLLSRDFKFDAAHNLIHYHGKCERLHGHTYHMRVTLSGKPSYEPDNEGMIMDFTELKKIVKELVLSHLDHSYINEIIENPTAEHIAMWVFEQLEAPLKRENCGLYEIKIWETEGSFVTCRREDCNA